MTEYLVVDHLSRKDIGRIFAKIKVDPVTGCWEWIGALNTYGYGEVWFRGGMEQSHRLLYAWIVGPIPKGVGPDIPNLDHIICDNPPCCNPAHLDLTLPKDNLSHSNSASAVNARKTHCIRGHLLPTESNRSNGKGRKCKICLKQTCAAYYQNVAKPRRAAAKPPKPSKPILTEEERLEKNRQYHRAYRDRNREAQRKYHHEYYEQKHQAVPLP